MKISVAVAVAVLAFCVGTSAQNRSVYTNLSGKGCRTLRSNPNEGGSYLGECPGVGGYKLQVLEGDLRQSINVIGPGRRKSELNLWNISGGFSSLGETAEWRLKGSTPVALIIRFNVSENPEDSSKVTSYLVVAKITKGLICVTDALKPTRSHNFEARRAADSAAVRGCRYLN